MKTLDNLTAEYLRERVIYDAEKGIFIWKYCPSRLKQWNTRYAGKTAGRYRRKGGYYIMDIDKVRYLGHRLVWLYITGKWPEQEIDHIDRNPRNNRFDNLREASHAENLCNISIKKNNTSGTPGLHLAPDGKWNVSLTRNYKVVYVGRYADKKQAIAARNKAANDTFGEFSPTFNSD